MSAVTDEVTKPKGEYMKNKWKIITRSMVLLFFSTMLFFMFYRKHELLENYKITAGKVTEINRPGWKSYGDFSVHFEYIINGIKYKSDVNYKYCTGLGASKVNSLLVGKYFPIVYAVSDPQTSTILLTIENAARFKTYQLPDSLKRYDSVLHCK